jgi:flavin-dependent dehydrogenase
VQHPPLPFEAVAGTTWDALVIGAGPAGAMAARALAWGGARVLLVEKARFPRWKVCGACLNGQALGVLRAAGLGSLVAREGGIALEEFQVRCRGRTARIALPAGAVLSRAKLDAALVEAARDAGAAWLPETQACAGAVRHGARTVGLRHRGRTILASARVVLVASGLGPAGLERGEGLRTWIAARSRLGAGCVVENAPDFYHAGTIFMVLGRAGYVGVVRLDDGSLNIAAAFAKEGLRAHGAPGRAASAVLAEAGVPPIPALRSVEWKGTARLTRRTWPPAGERLFLLGDAAGYVEPFTGQGIAWALASGQAVAPLASRAIEHWEPRLTREWASLHRWLIRRRQGTCRALALMLRQPWLPPLALALVDHVPSVTEFILRRVNTSSINLENI